MADVDADAPNGAAWFSSSDILPAKHMSLYDASDSRSPPATYKSASGGNAAFPTDWHRHPKHDTVRGAAEESPHVHYWS